MMDYMLGFLEYVCIYPIRANFAYSFFTYFHPFPWEHWWSCRKIYGRFCLYGELRYGLSMFGFFLSWDAFFVRSCRNGRWKYTSFIDRWKREHLFSQYIVQYKVSGNEFNEPNRKNWKLLKWEREWKWKKENFPLKTEAMKIIEAEHAYENPS